MQLKPRKLFHFLGAVFQQCAVFHSPSRQRPAQPSHSPDGGQHQCRLTLAPAKASQAGENGVVSSPSEQRLLAVQSLGTIHEMACNSKRNAII
jgi:hypothetical protein